MISSHLISLNYFDSKHIFLQSLKKSTDKKVSAEKPAEKNLPEKEKKHKHKYDVSLYQNNFYKNVFITIKLVCLNSFVQRLKT